MASGTILSRYAFLVATAEITYLIGMCGCGTL
jgi:hypothetical protein